MDKKAIVVTAEAATVRALFTRYLELGSVRALAEDLERHCLRTKPRKLKDGRIVGGVAFGVGGLAHLLKNRFYIGEVVYRGETFRGDHEPILDPALFAAVQAKLASQAVERCCRIRGLPTLLTGRLFDEQGRRMTPTHTTKNGVRYSYYVSQAVLRKRSAGLIGRVPAPELVGFAASSCGGVAALVKLLTISQRVENGLVFKGQQLGRPSLARIIVKLASEIKEAIKGPCITLERLLPQHHERSFLGRYRPRPIVRLHGQRHFQGALNIGLEIPHPLAAAGGIARLARLEPGPLGGPGITNLVAISDVVAGRIAVGIHRVASTHGVVGPNGRRSRLERRCCPSAAANARCWRRRTSG